MRFLAAALLALVAVALERPAFAARAGTVDQDQAEMYEGPGKKYKLVEKLPKGTQIAASNFPTEGFFKVKTASGSSGWISADSLVLGPPPSEDSSVVAATPSAPGGPVSSAPGFRNARIKKRVRFKLLSGLDLFSVSDINDLLGITAVKLGYNFGGELQFIFTNDLAMVVRFERIAKNLIARDVTLKNFQLDFASTPVMVGVDLTLSSEGKLSTHVGLMGGLAIQTELIVTDLSDPAPNVTNVAAHAFTGYAKVEAAWAFSKVISGFVEGGYRVLKTIPIQASGTANGAQILQQNGNFVPFTLDYGGPVIGVGVSAVF